MNKKMIITALLAFVTMAGQGQVYYRIDGNTGHPDFTGTLYLYDYSSIVDSIQVVKGIITEHSGQLPHAKKCSLASRDWEISIKPLFIEDGFIHVEGPSAGKWYYDRHAHERRHEDAPTEMLQHTQRI